MLSTTAPGASHRSVAIARPRPRIPLSTIRLGVRHAATHTHPDWEIRRAVEGVIERRAAVVARRDLARGRHWAIDATHRLIADAIGKGRNRPALLRAWLASDIGRVARLLWTGDPAGDLLRLDRTAEPGDALEAMRALAPPDVLCALDAHLETRRARAAALRAERAAATAAWRAELAAWRASGPARWWMENTSGRRISAVMTTQDVQHVHQAFRVYGGGYLVEAHGDDARRADYLTQGVWDSEGAGPESLPGAGAFSPSLPWP